MTKKKTNILNQLNQLNGFTSDYLESLEEGFLVFDTTGEIIIANDAFCNMSGFLKKELLGAKAPFPFWPKNKHDEFSERFDKIIKKQLKGEFNGLYQHKEGNEYPIIAYVSNIKDENEDVIAYIILVQNATEYKPYNLFDFLKNNDLSSVLNYRKKYLDLIVHKKLAYKLENTLNHITDGFILLDSNWCYVYVNKKAAELIERDPKSILGKHLWTEFPDIVKSKFYDAYQKAVKTQRTQFFEDYFAPNDKWFENRVYPTEDGLSIYFTDITERKRYEEKLIESERLFKRLTSKAPAAIFQTDINGFCNYVNEKWTQYAGITYDEAMGYGWSKAIHPDDKDRIVVEWEHYMKSDLFELETDFRFKHKDNTVRWVSVKTVGTYDSENNPNGYIGMALDTTDRKIAEEKLINSEKLFRGLAANAPVGIFKTDLNGACNFVNQQWIDSAEMPFKKAMDFGWIEAIHPEDRDDVVGAWLQIVPTGKDFNIDFRFLNKKRKTKWVSVKAVGTYNAQNKLYGYIGVLIDISDRKIAEDRLINSEKLFRGLAANAPVGIFKTNKDGACNFVNQEWMNYSGLSFKEALGYGWVNGLHEEDKDRVLKEWQASIIGKVDFEIDCRFINKKGIITWMSVKAIGLFDVNKILYGYLGTCLDITERKKSEDEIISSKIYLDNIINNIGDPVFVKNEKSEVILVNNAACAFFNLTKEEILNKTKTINESCATSFSFLKNDASVLSSGLETVTEETFEVSKTLTKTISTKKTRFIDNKGNRFIIGVIRDITHIKKTEIELEKHKNKLEELVVKRTAQLEEEKVKAQSADLMKSAFLATMSHELRTPMNSIIGFTSVLLKEFSGPLNDEQKKQLSMVKSSSDHLLGLINDVLDISKIEAGKLDVVLKEFDYLLTLEKTIEILMPQAQKKQLTVVSEISVTKVNLHSDQRRVKQILINLLNNAIKFSNSGTITIKVDQEKDWLVTQVVDQGIGISKQNLSHLFKPFMQLEGGLSRNHEGTGLGLAITKSLVEKLGGTIDVKSKLNQGSRFTFKLPFNQ